MSDMDKLKTKLETNINEAELKSPTDFNSSL